MFMVLDATFLLARLPVCLELGRAAKDGEGAAEADIAGMRAGLGDGEAPGASSGP